MPTIEVAKQGAKKFAVVNDGQVTEVFRTKREAEAEADKQRQDEQEPQVATHEQEQDPEAFANLVSDKLARIAAAKAEAAAVKAWKAAGSEGDQPPTPVLDWMSNTTPADKAKAAAKSNGHRASTRSPEQEQLILDTIRNGRSQGLSFAKIGKQLDEAGVPTARGGAWDFAVVAAIAHRNGLSEKVA
jgi:hypothetical protein